MNEKPVVLVVDDDVALQKVFAAALKSHYEVIPVGNGLDALDSFADVRADAVLLDVSMPGIDGYETCRRLKADPATATIPVIFVSALDTIENRLKGYEAGGDDYVVKPFNMAEVIAKLAHLIQAVRERDDLRQQVDIASSTAMIAMTSLSELGTLVQVNQSYGGCTTHHQLAEAILHGLAAYGMRGAVQVRGDDEVISRSNSGKASPLESSILARMADEMDRIVQFKSRLSINYTHVSLLVYDLPIDDEERCGRLRDHLAMLMEGAEARFQVIRHGFTVNRTIERITRMLSGIDQSQRDRSVAARLAVDTMTRHLEQECTSVALSPAQEDVMVGVIQRGVDELINAQTDTVGLQNQLSRIVTELKSIAISGGMGVR